ncbi:MAG: UDP-N-acetylmuramate dehydrogenase [Actinomycetota bacterium]|nr:UDP-N-acetylmuramate dehydrogenase [Actinomycetota bacterium]
MTSPATTEAGSRLAGRARRDVPLAPYTTYRVGGPAALLVELDDDADARAVAEVVAATGVAVLVVGRGSNLLVADDGFDGLAVTLGEGFADIDIDGTVVRAGGAARLPVVARRTAAAGLTGFEWAVGVPGSVGGGVRMNAGGHGSDMAATLRRARVLDLAVGEDTWVDAGDLALGYRTSAIAATDVVLAAELGLEPGDPTAGAALVSEIVAWRRAHQPGGQNAGSVFTNPPGDSAGRLIDTAGCKGLRIGGAEVSTKHANFIQVDPGGRAADVIAVMDAVRGRVREHHGVELVAETHLVGFDDEGSRAGPCRSGTVDRTEAER